MVIGNITKRYTKLNLLNGGNVNNSQGLRILAFIVPSHLYKKEERFALTLTF